MIQKYSVLIAGHRTSISLEPEFMAELKKIAAKRNLPVAALITEIDAHRALDMKHAGGLSSALRVFVLNSLIKPEL